LFAKNNEWVEEKKAEAKAWEAHESLCCDYVCDNLKGNITIDFCVGNNTSPQCFKSECQQEYGNCSHISLYTGNETGCVKSIECGSKGWEETPRDCKAEILADPNTPAEINQKTSSCYDFECDGGKCSYIAHSECDKVCDDDAVQACQAAITSPFCVRYSGCSKVISSNVWVENCDYEFTYDRKQLNECYEVVCEGEVETVRKTDSAKACEEQVDDCWVCECQNSSGIVTRNVCSGDSSSVKSSGINPESIVSISEASHLREMIILGFVMALVLAFITIF